ncbi:hypothetical protein STEG23_008556 [Scotinomys teguina]
METKDSKDWDKPQRKSVSSSWKSNQDPTEMRPELLPENKEAPEETQDEEFRCHIPIQRNSIFNRAMRHKRRARGMSEKSASHQAEKLNLYSSVQEHVKVTASFECHIGFKGQSYANQQAMLTVQELFFPGMPGSQSITVPSGHYWG